MSNKTQIVLKYDDNNNILDELKNVELKNAQQENINDNNNINENSFEFKLIIFQKKSSILTIKNNIKHKNKTLFLEKMKFNFEIYSNDYYNCFIKNIPDQIIKDYNNNFNELTQTLTDLAINSLNL